MVDENRGGKCTVMHMRKNNSNLRYKVMSSEITFAIQEKDV